MGMAVDPFHEMDRRQDRGTAPEGWRNWDDIPGDDLLGAAVEALDGAAVVTGTLGWMSSMSPDWAVFSEDGRWLEMLDEYDGWRLTK